ncbi:hypothetical protein OESDEN_10360 [Oesophagostomum dentatum]|uniref:Protein kinase domain-containing protein n=1 Tax=Oesophagostomum dentatum TaxID=61180 RepID=A0A0B1T0Y0_OESDE|nr:hypothetical protein OESDEN_10360 [Oesophagostomum dentatum]
MPDTLGSLIENSALDLTDMKLYTWQMFNGLQYLCQLQIMHRDIKPVNILADHAIGLLKIGDFGSAKVVRPGMTSTPYQVTRFYRPPELLLGSENYNWTVGRSMNVSKLPDYFTHQEIGTGLGQLLPSARPDVIYFLGKILVYRPRARLGGKNVLRDPFFDSLFRCVRQKLGVSSESDLKYFSREGATRSNGQPISRCITSSDIAEAHSIDESKVKTKLSSILMRTKLDFSCEDDSRETTNGGVRTRTSSKDSAEGDARKKRRSRLHRRLKSGGRKKNLLHKSMETLRNSTDMSNL